MRAHTFYWISSVAFVFSALFTMCLFVFLVRVLFVDCFGVDVFSTEVGPTSATSGFQVDPAAFQATSSESFVDVARASLTPTATEKDASRLDLDMLAPSCASTALQEDNKTQPSSAAVTTTSIAVAETVTITNASATIAHASATVVHASATILASAAAATITMMMTRSNDVQNIDENNNKNNNDDKNN